jgi:predicted exporter
MRRLAALAIMAAAAVTASGYSWKNLEISTDLGSLLSSEGEQHRIARALSSSGLADMVVFTVAGDTVDTTVSATLALADRLRSSGALTAVQAGPDDLKPAELYQALFASRIGLAPTREWTADELRLAARDLKRRLSLPTGSFARMMASSDPLGLYFLATAELKQNAVVEPVGKAWLTRDERYGVITSRVAEPSNADAAVEEIEEIISHFAVARGPSIEIEWTGVHRFSHFARQHIRADVQRITLLVTLAIIALYLLAFRKVRYLGIGVAPTALGLICALAVTLRVFGAVHGVALAFGATLLGISIDFATHFLAHLVVTGRKPHAAMRVIRPSLALGAATTVAGFAGLAALRIEVFQQIAVFSAVGILVALAVTVFLLPNLLKAHELPSPATSPLRALGRHMANSAGARTFAKAVAVISVVLATVGIFRLSWTDDVMALNTVSQVIVDESDRIRQRLGSGDVGRFVVAHGKSDEEALQANDAVAQALSRLVRDGELGGYQSVSRILPSARTQRQRHEALATDVALRARFEKVFAEEGFVPGTFQPFFAELSGERAPLRLEDLEGTPLGDLLTPFVVGMDGEVGIVTSLTGVRDGVELAAKLEHDGVPATYIDQEALMEEAYGHARRRSLSMLVIGLFFVLALVGVRYRSFDTAVRLVAFPALAGAVSLAAWGLAGSPANIMHVVAVLLVLSVGVDYTIFVNESHHDELSREATSASVLICFLTTLVAFGALAFSVSPVLRSLGVTIALGVAIAAVLAPLSVRAE